MIAILLGAPGSGKGTQAKFLSAKYGLSHLATGDIFRNEIAEKTPLWVKAQAYVKSGKLVPDDLVTEMVAARFNSKEGRYLLDGFPRNLAQAQSLSTILAHENLSIDLVVLLKISQELALERIVSRRVCSQCGEVYNIQTKPAPGGKCLSCGGDVILREDDSETTARKRLMVFEDITRPMIAYYQSESVFKEVDAGRKPEEVSAALSMFVDSIFAKP